MIVITILRLNSSPCGTWRQANKSLGLTGRSGGGTLCFSPCGRFLAAGGSEGRIQVWDVESRSLEETYIEDQDAQTHPYYPPEGGLIAAVAFPSHSKIEIQHLEKGEKLDEFECRGNRRTVRFSANGTQLAVSCESEIKIWTKDHNAESTPFQPFMDISLRWIH